MTKPKGKTRAKPRTAAPTSNKTSGKCKKPLVPDPAGVITDISPDTGPPIMSTDEYWDKHTLTRKLPANKSPAPVCPNCDTTRGSGQGPYVYRNQKILGGPRIRWYKCQTCHYNYKLSYMPDELKPDLNPAAT